MSILVFNSEHDQCLANGNCNYDPPLSSLRLSRDCAAIMKWLQDESSDNPQLQHNCCRPVVWGWDSVVRKRIASATMSSVTKPSAIKSDAHSCTAAEILAALPDDDELAAIRDLSHRRYAVMANRFIFDSLPPEDLPFLCDVRATELFDVCSVRQYCDKHASIILKAPWSGSGKGLRWIRKDEFSQNDEQWCRKVIAKQGSVAAERRRRVVCDFAMLYYINNQEVVREGLSLFLTECGAYRGNVLASDEAIVRHLEQFVPEKLLDDVDCCLRSFLKERFVGRYTGPLGVDMFVCDGGESDASSGAPLPQRRFQLVPCVELNVRNTMGRLARRYYDACLAESSSESVQEGEPLRVMRMLHSDTAKGLRTLLEDAEAVISEPEDDSLYALAVFRSKNK